MGYDLKPKNKNLDYFHFGAFSYPVLLEACGYLWPFILDGGRYYSVPDIDKRFDGEYPRILTNDGFRITASEAKIMARCARNFVAIQRTLPDKNMGTGFSCQNTFKKEDLIDSLMRGLSGANPGPWPKKIRSDFVDKLEKFAEWAEKSQGFRIY